MQFTGSPGPQGRWVWLRRVEAGALALVAIVVVQTHTYDSKRDGSRVWTVDVVAGEVIISHGMHYCQWGEC